MTWHYLHVGLSDAGVRAQNEDQWFADPAFGLYIVSDGMGGHFAGKVASSAVVETVAPLLKDRLRGIGSVTDPKVTETVVTTITEVSDRLYGKSHGQPGLDGMGATIVLALVREGNALIAHLGDSRAYHYHERLLERLTQDHSILQLLVDNDEISPKDVAVHPARGQITRFVGMGGETLVDTCVVSLQPNDHLLLCSDGLTDMLSDEEIRDVFAAFKSPQAMCQRLVDAANAAGGRDDITVVDVFAEPITNAVEDEKRPTKMDSSAISLSADSANKSALEGSGSFAPFPTTTWTLIRQAQQSETLIRQLALDQLVRLYWKPLYAYYRSKSQTRQDAQDLVQECLWSLSQGGISRLEQGETRFRSWLKTCARNVLIDWVRRKNAKRRRPLERAVSFERLKAEDGEPFEPGGGERPEDAFREAWRRSILERALQNVRQLSTQRNRASDFEIFLEYYDSSTSQAFEIVLARPNEGDGETASQGPETERRVTWEEIAKRRGLDGWRAASRRAEWVKGQLATAIRNEISQYAESDSEVDEEIRELLR